MIHFFILLYINFMAEGDDIIMKTNVDRIQYYTRKAAQLSSLRRPGSLRFYRLMEYKSALAERLRQEKDELNRVLLVFGPAPKEPEL